MCRGNGCQWCHYLGKAMIPIEFINTTKAKKMTEKNVMPPEITTASEFRTIIGAAQYWYKRARFAERNLVFRMTVAAVGGFILAYLLTGCSSTPQSLRSLATAKGAAKSVEAVCMLAHSWDGVNTPEQAILETQAVHEWCSRREYLVPWAELAEQARRIVEAQRNGKPHPDLIAPYSSETVD